MCLCVSVYKPLFVCVLVYYGFTLLQGNDALASLDGAFRALSSINGSLKLWVGMWVCVSVRDFVCVPVLVRKLR